VFRKICFYYRRLQKGTDQYADTTGKKAIFTFRKYLHRFENISPDHVPLNLWQAYKNQFYYMV